jgi:hypothetical protein
MLLKNFEIFPVRKTRVLVLKRYDVVNDWLWRRMPFPLQKLKVMHKFSEARLRELLWHKTQAKGDNENALRLRAGEQRGSLTNRAGVRTQGGRLPAHLSGKGQWSDRKQLARLLSGLDDGDTVIVTRLYLLARSTRDLLNTLAAIGTANATFRSPHNAWVDTTTPHGRLGQFFPLHAAGRMHSALDALPNAGDRTVQFSSDNRSALDPTLNPLSGEPHELCGHNYRNPCG